MIKILNFYQKLNFALNFLLNKKFNELELIKKHIQKSSIVFDIGSNLGNYIQFISKKLENFNLEIHSFDPISSLIEDQKKMKLNSKHKLKLNNTAVFNSDDKVNFYENNIPSQSTIVVNNNQIGKVVKSYPVKTIKLDTYCSENNIAEIGFIKIDVEGSELSVLKSANNLLRNKKIHLIKVEISNTHKNFYDVVNYIKNFDYKIVSIDNLFFKNNYLKLLEVYFEKN